MKNANFNFNTRAGDNIRLKQNYTKEEFADSSTDTG